MINGHSVSPHEEPSLSLSLASKANTLTYEASPLLMDVKVLA